MPPHDPFDTTHLQRNLGGLAARGGAILVFGQGIQLVLSIATTIFLARLLVPEDFGLVAMVTPFVGFLAFFRDSGLQIATVQQNTINHQQISTLFWFNLGLGFFLMVLIGLLAPAIARFFGRDELLWITLGYAVNMLIGGASIQHNALLTRQMAFGKLATVAIVSQSIGLAVAVSGAWRGLGYWALVAMAVSTTLAQSVLVWYLSGWAPGLPQRGSGVRRMLAFGGGLTISNLINQAAQYIDTILIGRMLGAVPLGYYDRAKQLFWMPLMQLMGPLASVSIPTLSRLADPAERYAQVYLRIQQKLLIFTALFSAFLVAYGDLVILLLLGPRWALVGPILTAFAVGGLIAPVSSSLSWLLVTQGRSRDLAYWSPWSLMFRGAAIFCGYRWGIIGIATSIAIFQYVSFIAFCTWVGRRGPVTTAMVLKNVVPTMIAGAVSCAVSFPVKAALTKSSLVVSLGTGAVMSTLVFFVVLWLVPGGRSAVLDMWRLAKISIGQVRHDRERS